MIIQAQQLKESTPYNEKVDAILGLIEGAGRPTFTRANKWEVTLVALIITIMPRCKLQQILEGLPHHFHALDEADVLNCMAHLGYICKKTTLKPYQIDTRLYPCLCLPIDNNPHDDAFVLYRSGVSAESYMYDASGKVTPAHVGLADKKKKHQVWFFSPYDEHSQPTSKFMRKASRHGWFRALLGRFKGTFVQVMCAGFVLNLITLVTPLFIMLVYDRVIATGSLATLPMLAVGALLTIGFEWKMRQVRSTGLSWFAGRLDNVIGNKIFSHLVGLSPTLIERASVTSQIARIKTFESVRDFFSGSVFMSLIELPYVVIAFAAVSLIAGTLVFVPLFMALGYIALFVIIRQKIKVHIRLAAKCSSARQQFTIETFEKMEGIRTQGLGKKWFEKFRHLSGREQIANFNLAWYGMIAEHVGHALTVITAVATIGLGVGMIWEGAMTTGALVATMILVWRILTPFYSVCTMISRLEQLRNSTQQINDLIDIDTEAEEARSFSRLPALKGRITFDHVSFRYGEEKDDVFNHLSFDAEPGDLITITGHNGSGKASILKLVQALHTPTGGQVRIDGFDIRQLDAPDLRSKIAYVPKTPYLFSGSLSENMRFANLLATAQELQQALELAGAWEDVQALPQGLETHIHERGIASNINLLTRLSLARAYLHPGNILLVDELPNALLSGAAGKHFKEYLQRAKGKRTVLFCTYRRDFMQLADQIIWLKNTNEPIAGERDDMLALLTSSQQSSKGATR